MEFNMYYPPQPGHPSPPVTSLHGGQLMQQHSPQGGQMMHSQMTLMGTRQGGTVHVLHQPQMQQHQQHLGHHTQQMPLQQQQHPNYHHIQQPHSHGSPVSHAGSPHPQQQHLNHNHQTTLSAPSPQQSVIQSQHLMHPQSPHHHVGSPMHMQQQPMNKMGRSSLASSGLNHPQSGLQLSHHHQSQNSYNGGGTMHAQANLNHYPHQNQHHALHLAPNKHQQHHQQQQHHQPSIKHHASLIQSNNHHVQHGVGRNSPYHSSCILQTEIRIIELNRRLQCRPIARHPVSPLPNSPFDESLWWEKFASEFFEDDATLTIRIQDDKPTDYTINRTLIPRFFKSYFAGGVTDLSINLRNPKEASMQPQLITLDCDQAFIMTNNVFRHPAVTTNQAVVVHTEGHLILDFVSNSLDSLSIKSWRFYTKSCREYIDRSITTIGLPNTILVEPLTFQGLPNSTMIFLRMCTIMKHMQELMSQQKMTNLSPRVCLKKMLFDKYRFKSEDDTKPMPVTKRRKRKPPTSPSATGNTSTAASTKRSRPSANQQSTLSAISPPAISNLPPLNIMVVGEPSSMGTEYRDENERSISKIENSNFTSPVDASARKSDSPKAIEIELELNGKGQSDAIVEKPDNLDADSERQDVVVKKVDNVVVTNGEMRDKSLESSNSNTLESKVESIKDVTPSPPQPSPTQSTPPPTMTTTGTTTTTTAVQVCTETEPIQSVVVCMNTGSQVEQSDNVDLDEPVEKEKENNISLVLNDETHTSSIATQSENHYNIMNSIPEDREDNLRSTSCDSIAKLPPSSNNKNTLTPNGTSNKQNRRRSSERKETLREGLMRTSDFVVKMVDLKCEHPPLWRITTGNNLLQQFEPKTQNGVVLYENTNQYAGWNHEIKKEYVGVDVKLTQHTRNQITVERLLLNFQKIEKPENFYDKHFVIYLQILISTALDPKFWESIENEPKHHEYFITSRRIVEDITKRFKIKLSSKLKLSEAFMKNVEKYPNLVVKAVEQDEKELFCRACSTNLSTQVVSFGNRSYDLHSYKPVKVTSESDDKDLHSHLCEACFDMVKLYSDIHHMGWTLYNIAKDKVELHRTFGKPINAILDECLKDEEWLSTIYTERDSLWSKVELIQ